MRLAVLSDIHGNLTALEAVVADLKTMGVDSVVHGGDLVASGARPAQVVDIIRESGCPGICGNTDEMLWRPELLAELELKAPSKHGLRRVLFNDIAPATCELLGEERVAWLRSFPTQWSGQGVTVVHASPDNLWRAPLANASDNDLDFVRNFRDLLIALEAAQAEATLVTENARDFARWKSLLASTRKTLNLFELSKTA